MAKFPANPLTKFRAVYTVTFLSPVKLSGTFAPFVDGRGSSARSDPLVIRACSDDKNNGSAKTECGHLENTQRDHWQNRRCKQQRFHVGLSVRLGLKIIFWQTAVIISTKYIYTFGSAVHCNTKQWRIASRSIWQTLKHDFLVYKLLVKNCQNSVKCQQTKYKPT